MDPKLDQLLVLPEWNRFHESRRNVGPFRLPFVLQFFGYPHFLSPHLVPERDPRELLRPAESCGGREGSATWGAQSQIQVRGTTTKQSI